MSKAGIVTGIALGWLAGAAGVPAAAPRGGEAIVASQAGSVQARVLSGPVHYGKSEVKDLSEGLAVGESAQLTSGKNGRACIVLSPGAILCVAPETSLTFRQLRHSADGLPKSEEDLVRRIHIDLHGGRIMIHAGAPAASMDIRIRTEEGEVILQGGTAVVAQTGKGEWAVISEKFDASVKPVAGAEINVPEGSAVRMNSRGAEPDNSLLDSPARQFEVCSCYFDDLETYIHDPGGFDRAGLSEYIGTQSGVIAMDAGEPVFDVSPARRSVFRNERFVPRSSGAGTQTRWDEDRAWHWYENLGVVKGVNYIPRNAVNSVEMWMKETFDPQLIDEELGWAQDAGYTTLRVQLQFAVWQADPDGFLERLKKFVEIAGSHQLQVVPVLFDDRNFAQTEPKHGPQPAPLPGVHNAHWVPSPAPAVVTDRNSWPELERYVKSVISEFKRDDRVAYWDLYNRSGDGGLWEKSLPLMDQTFNWAREIDPQQPLAVPAWTRPESAMTARMLEKSDIITFQSFESAEYVESKLLLLKRYKRPIICSDWLMRQKRNDFEQILPLFSVHRVGWFSRGLVQGRTQQWIHHDQHRDPVSPDLWQHDILKADGSPYRDEELKMIQEFRFFDKN